MLTLTVDSVLALNPCEKYTKKYLKKLFNGRESVHLSDALVEAQISFADRIWLIDAVLTKPEHKFVLVEWTIYCAEDVLPFFEQAYPQDKRPRLAIQAAKDYQKGLISLEAVKQAQIAAKTAARYAAGNPAAYATANAVAYAVYAATATYVSDAATYVAIYAIAADCNADWNAKKENQAQYFTKLAELIKNF